MSPMTERIVHAEKLAADAERWLEGMALAADPDTDPAVLAAFARSPHAWARFEAAGNPAADGALLHEMRHEPLTHIRRRLPHHPNVTKATLLHLAICDPDPQIVHDARVLLDEIALRAA